MISSEITNTLNAIAGLLSHATDPWWILGSAAVALKGYDAGTMADIDVLVSPTDAERLMQAHAIKNDWDGGTKRYRSSHFLRPDFGPLPVEIMAGFEVSIDGTWTKVWPTSRERVQIKGADLFVPSDADLIEIFTQLGRAKDLQRIQAMIEPK